MVSGSWWISGCGWKRAADGYEPSRVNKNVLRLAYCWPIITIVLTNKEQDRAKILNRGSGTKSTIVWVRKKKFTDDGLHSWSSNLWQKFKEQRLLLHNSIARSNHFMESNGRESLSFSITSLFICCTTLFTCNNCVNKM